MFRIYSTKQDNTTTQLAQTPPNQAQQPDSFDLSISSFPQKLKKALLNPGELVLLFIFLLPLTFTWTLFQVFVACICILQANTSTETTKCL